MSEQANQVLQVLAKAGVDTSKFPDELKIEITKTLAISHGPKLALDTALPYPIPEDKHYIDYFIQDKLVEIVRDFLQTLLRTQGSNETLIYKMAAECPATIMNNKEIVMQLERLAEKNVPLANNFIHIHSWYSASEAFKWRFVYGVAQQLEQVKIHYNRLCRQYVFEVDFHGAEDVYNAHEVNAKIDYLSMRELLHELENKVNMLAEITSKMGAEEPYRVPKRLFESASTDTSSEKKKDKKDTST
jgi:hypothetical protein